MAGKFRCSNCGESFTRRRDLSRARFYCIDCSALAHVEALILETFPGSQIWHKNHEATLRGMKNMPIDPASY